MGGKLFTDKLVLRWLEGFGVWSLDSATLVTLLLATSAYPAHASGSSKVEFFPWGAKGPGSGGTKKRGGKSYKEVIKKG
jgi:hypothetical protein